jgi:hypothetical protein
MASSRASIQDSGAQDTFYVGNLKGVGRVDQQTFIDTYSKSLVPTSMIARPRSRRQICSMIGSSPLFDNHEVNLLRVLTDRGGEYCGNPGRHEYEPYLAIEVSITRAPRPRARRPMASASASTRPC